MMKNCSRLKLKVLVVTAIVFISMSVCCTVCLAITVTATVQKIGGNWTIVVPPITVLSDLAILAKSRKSPVIVPACLTTGKWLAGRMSKNGTVFIVLTDSDLIGILPAWNNIELLGPASTIIRVRFDSSPITAADKDLSAVINARKYSLMCLAGGNLTIVHVGAVTKRLLLTFNGVPHQPIAGMVRMSTGLPFRFALAPSDFVQSSENSNWRIGVIDVSEEGSVESLEITEVDQHRVQLIDASRIGIIRSSEFKKFSERSIRLASHEAIPLFRFDEPSLKGWEIRGHAWGVTDSVGEFFSRKGDSRYFADSKVDGGEPATGSILSPPFLISGAKLRFLANGHSKKNYFALVDAKTEEELVRSPVPEKTGPFEAITWDVSKFQGRKVRFMAVDNDTASAYAWLAFDNIEMLP